MITGIFIGLGIAVVIVAGVYIWVMAKWSMF